MEIIHVSSQSNPTSLSESILSRLRSHGSVELKAATPRIITQALKGIALARETLVNENIGLICLPSFSHTENEEGSLFFIKIVTENKGC